MQNDFEDREKAFQLAMDRFANSDDGILILQELMKLCGWEASSMTALDDRGNIDPLKSAFNDGQRNIWWKLRLHIPRQAKIHIELPELPVVHKDEQLDQLEGI